METTFSRWLREQMQAAGLNQSQLAKRIHVNQGAISRLVNGITKPAPETLKAIARVLHLSQEDVYREAGLLPPEADGLNQRFADLSPANRRMIEELIDFLIKRET